MNRIFLPLFLLIILVLSFKTSATDDGRLALFDAEISPDGRKVVFEWAGDIWIAEITSGRCSRITDHVGQDESPAWFPDGRKIAFTSNRDGNGDVYTIPVAGGIPTRHTWHGLYDSVVDVSPDGESILFTSPRSLYSVDLYEVDLYGGLPRPVTQNLGLNRFADYSSTGDKIVVSRGSSSWTRRNYNGSGSINFYVMNRDGSSQRWIENGYDGIDEWPVFGPDDESIYFISDRDGMENVYRIPASGGVAQQLTFFTDRPVLFLSISEEGRLCFIQDFKLWIKDPDSDPVQVNLDLASEPKHSQDIRLDISGNISEFTVSPDGTLMAMIARGELYIKRLHSPDETVPLGAQRFEEAIRVTDTSSRERSVSWHPDGDRVVFTSDQDGNSEIYEMDLRTYEWNRITRTSEEEYLPIYTPDGARLAFYRGNNQLVIRDMESGVETAAVEMYLQDSPWPNYYEWSPDGNWIGFTGPDVTYEYDVYLLNVGDDLGEPVNVTMHHDPDQFAGWAADGKSIYFLTGRDIVDGLLGWGWWSKGNQVYSLPLLHEPPPRSDVLEFPEETEATDEESSDENDADDDEEISEEPIEIDFVRITERARRVSSTGGGGWNVSLSPDGKTFVYTSNATGVTGLWSIPFEGGNASLIANVPSGVGYLQWAPDSKGVYYLSDSHVYFWNKNSGSVSQAQTYGRLTVDLIDERFQMINEAGRILENHFYDGSLHETDWNSAVEYYAPLFAETTIPEEFQILMRMLFGELDASHLGSWGSVSNEGIGANPGFLGLDFDPFTEGPGLRVTKVWPRGPADYDETRIETGEWVLEINGAPVSTSNNYWAILDDTFSRSTTLTVSSGQEGTETRDVTLAPVMWSGGDSTTFNFYEILYFNWVENNKQLVEIETDRRIGYIHIPGMSGTWLEKFATELFSENYSTDALILDVRFNGGGNIEEWLLDILSRPQFGWRGNRDMVQTQVPSLRYDKPIVLLINERSFSDAEIFPSGFRELGLGTIIGESTFGGVIGTWNIPLVDGVTWMRVPMYGWWRVDGTNMENDGVVPDIRIEQDLNHLNEGIDDQLNYAIEYLLQRL